MPFHLEFLVWPGTKKGGEEKLNTLEHFGKKMPPGDSAITSHDLERLVHKDDIARVGPLPSM